MNMEKVTWTKNNNKISDKKSFASNLCATAKEHIPKGFEEKIKMTIGKRRTIKNGFNLISAHQ